MQGSKFKRVNGSKQKKTDLHLMDIDVFSSMDIKSAKPYSEVPKIMRKQERKIGVNVEEHFFGYKSNFH